MSDQSAPMTLDQWRARKAQPQGGGVSLADWRARKAAPATTPEPRPTPPPDPVDDTLSPRQAELENKSWRGLSPEEDAELVALRATREEALAGLKREQSDWEAAHPAPPPQPLDWDALSPEEKAARNTATDEGRQPWQLEAYGRELDPEGEGNNIASRLVLSPWINAAGAVESGKRAFEAGAREDYGETALESLRAAAQGVAGVAFPGATAAFTAAPEPVQRAAAYPFQKAGEGAGYVAGLPQRIAGDEEGAERTQHLVGGAGEVLIPLALPAAAGKARLAIENVRANRMLARNTPAIEPPPTGRGPVQFPIERPAPGATPEILPRPRQKLMGRRPQPLGFKEPRAIGPAPEPPSTIDLAGVNQPTGLANRVAKAGFKDFRAAVEAVMRGDENALSMLKPADVDALAAIADKVKPKYVDGRLTRQSVEKAMPPAAPRPTRNPYTQIDPHPRQPKSMSLAEWRAKKAAPEPEGGPPVPVRTQGAGAAPRAERLPAEHVAAVEDLRQRHGGALSRRDAAEMLARQDATAARPVSNKPLSAAELAEAGDAAWEGVEPVQPTAKPQPAAPPVKQEPASSGFSRSQRGAVGDTPGGVSGSSAWETMKRGVKEAGQAVKGAATFGHNLLKTTRGSIKRIGGKHGEEIVRRLVDTETDADFNVNRWVDRWNEAWNAVPAKERKLFDLELDAITENRKPARSEAQAKAVQVRRQISREIAEWANEAGVRIDDEGGPRKIGTDWDEFASMRLRKDIAEGLHSGDPKAIEMWNKAMVGEGKAFETAAESDAALKTMRERRLRSFHPGTEMPRRVTLPDELREPSGYKSFRSYMEGAARNAAEQKHFKYRDPETGQLRGKDGQGDLGDLLERIREAGGDAERVKTYVLRDLRRHPETFGKEGSTLRGVNAIEGAYTGARLLSGSITNAAEQMSQIANQAIVGGVGDTARSLGRFVRHPRRSMKNALQKGARRPVSEYTVQTGFEESPVGHTAQNVSKGLNVVSLPQSVMDAAARSIAHEGAALFGEKMSKRLNSKRTDFLAKATGTDAASAERVLTKLEMTPEEIGRIRDGTMTERDVVKLGQRFVKGTSLESRAGNRMTAASNPGMQWFFRMKNFSHAQAKFYADHVFREAAKGNVAPLARALAMSQVVGEVIGGVKDVVTGPSKTRPDIDEILKAKDAGEMAKLAGKRFVDNLSNVAFGGLVGKAVMAAFGIGPSQSKRPAADTAKNLFYPPAADTIEDIVSISDDARDRGVGSAATNFFKRQFPGPRQFGRTIKLATPDGVRDQMRETMTEGGEVRKGQEGYRKRLRKRRDWLDRFSDE